MLTTQTPREVETSGMLETAQFTIAANGKAFKILIDGLYSDKIAAVVRELWTNAYDSHAEAGCADRPFDCHLPNVWQPHFAVRDYGVSLSHDAVMRLYTRVFASSKEDTNTQVGKLGLGSKSPFAYTDTFTVTAWRSGQKRVYSAYIGEDHIPRISLMSEEDSEEAQGLEVSFPVKSEDFNDFRYRAEALIEGFEPRPNVPGVSADEKRVLLSGTGWKLHEEDDSPRAKQGCVIYPIDVDAVRGLTSDQRSLLRAGFLIDFPVGELDIAANREGLSYDATTCANIQARLQQIEDELVAQITEKIVEAKTLQDARRMAKALRNGGLPECAHKLIKKLRWRGKDLADQATFEMSKELREHVSITRYNHSYHTTRRRYKQNYIRTGIVDISYSPDSVFVWIDATTPVQRVEEKLAYLYYDGKLGREGHNYVIRVKAGTMAEKRVLVGLARPENIIRLNDVVLPKKERDREYVKVKAKVIDGKTGRGTTDTDINVGPDDTVYYVPAFRQEAKHNNHTHAFYTVYEVFKLAKTCGIIPADAKGYILPASLKNKARAKNFVNIFDLAQKHLDENFDAAKADAYREFDAVTDLGGNWSEIFTVAVKDGIEAPTSQSPLAVSARDWMAKIAAHLEQFEIANLIELNKALNNYFPKRYHNQDPIDVPEGAIDTYPMLARVLSGTRYYLNIDHDCVKDMFDYVNLIDANAPSVAQSVQEFDEAA